MNLSDFIAGRWAFSTPLKHTRNILRMGIVSMALCVTVMVVSLCILVGFKNQISQKVFGFGSHVVVQPYWSETEEDGISLLWDDTLQKQIDSLPQVASAQPYTLKGALIKGDEESFGVFFKGLPAGFDTVFFAERLEKGHLPRFEPTTDDESGTARRGSNQILISRYLSDKLRLDTGSRLRTFFVHQGQLRPRMFVIAGIYSTGLETFDASYLLCDIAQIQNLNGWSSLQADGIDIRLKNPSDRFDVVKKLDIVLPYEYSSFICDRLFPAIFDWLALIDANVLTLIIIMLIVCMICLTSLLFILIIERKPHIGVLKTLGAGNALVRLIFIKQTLMLLGSALLAGNILALLLCAIQKFTGILRLDESVYFLDRVPIAFPWIEIFGINLLIGTLAALLLGLLSKVLNRTTPAKLNKSR